tara:strand:+ start:1698 stop:1892 length:195 start_codon:yes stop_codon:yes gene_type:complete
MFYENETTPVVEAHYTNGSARKPATVAITERVRGDRQFKKLIAVTGKRQARKVAATYNAICWNF